MDKLKMAIDFFLSDQYDTGECLGEATDEDIIDVLIELYANIFSYSEYHKQIICRNNFV